MRLVLAIAISLVSSTAFALTGNFTATVSTVDLPKESVAGWMPPGVTLKDPDADFHKVFIFAGTQRNVAGIPPYKEIIVVVPEAVFRGRTYMYFPRLFLDNRAAIAGGRAGWGFPKIYGNMEEDVDGFELYAENTNEHLLTVATQIGTADVDRSSSQFQEVVELLSQPMLLYKGGRVLCSAFLMDLNSAELAPAAIDLEINDGFMAGLDSVSSASASITNARFGGFRMSHAFWRVPNTGRRCR